MDKKYLENTSWFDVFGRERIKLIVRKMRCRIDGRYLSREEKELVLFVLREYNRKKWTRLLPNGRADPLYGRALELLNQIELAWRPEWRTDHAEMAARTRWCIEHEKLHASDWERRRKRNERKEVVMRKIRRIFRKRG